jgi:2-methylisocitrate lyase-like PEP mutase family enzyme
MPDGWLTFASDAETGAGTTMSRLGMPDLGVATLNDMREHAAMIASLDRRVPLIADADTGYGGEDVILCFISERC